MTVDSLNQYRREGLVQRILILVTVIGIGSLFLVITLLSSPGSQPVSEERRHPAEKAGVIEEAIPAETSKTEPEKSQAYEDSNAASANVESRQQLDISTVQDPGSIGESEAIAALSNPIESGTLEGVVIRKGHNVPLRSIRLRLTDTEGREIAQTRTARDGSFAFRGLEPGKYYLKTVSENFSYRPKPIILSDEAVTGISFEALPNPPIVRIPAYSQIRLGVEVPSLRINVFRFGSVNYRLFKLQLAESFVNVTSFDELLSSDVSKMAPLESTTRRYTYPVSFSELSDTLDFDLDRPGLYLLEARAGSDSYRGLLSVSALQVVTTQVDSTLEVTVLGLSSGVAQPSALVKAVQNGRLVSENNTNISGMTSFDFVNNDPLELLVSDGQSFVYLSVEYEAQKLAMR